MSCAHWYPLVLDAIATGYRKLLPKSISSSGKMLSVSAISASTLRFLSPMASTM
jgi:hypothetical protein